MATKERGESQFYRVESIPRATRLLREHDAILVSGGQSLMPLIREGLVDRDVVVDISGVEAHDEIRVDDEGLHLGGLATHRDLIEADLRDTVYRALPETAKEIGDRQVRNWGTIGGSVAHADPSLDYPPPMIAMDAVVEYTDGESQREVPIDEFYLGQYFTVLEDHEIVTGVRVPRPPAGTGVAFEKFAWRRGDMSLVNAAAMVTVDGGRIENARLSVGAVAPTPLRLADLEDELSGTPADDAARRREVANRVPEFTDPVGEEHASVDYKNRIATNLAANVLDEAVDRARRSGGSE